MRLTFRPGLLISALLCSAIAGAGESGVRLPNIGSSAGEIMSPQQERNYGASMLHELRSLDLVLDDPLLSDYITSTGYRLVARSDKPEQRYTFFMVRDSGINAFAAPGGFIGVNAGLLTTAMAESELAAVLAHEIAHISQDHMLRAFEDSKKASLPIALAMLGALIASQGASGDAAEAAIVTGTSLMQQRQINFTRQDEIEADRVGIQTLARANFDPDAMAGFFGRMERALRPGNGEGQIPDLLRTHPVTTNRISDAKARAAVIRNETGAGAPDTAFVHLPLDYRDIGKPRAKDDLSAPASATAVVAPAVAVSDAPQGEYFLMMRERARVLASNLPNQTLAYYVGGLRDQAGFDTLSNRYGHALALERAGQSENARKALQSLAERAPQSLPIQIALAQTEAQTGRRTEALSRYERLIANAPTSSAIALSYAQTLIEDGRRNSARHAQELMRPLMAQEIDDPEIYRVFARASELANDKVRAAEAYADVALLNGRLEDALNQLRELTKRSDLDYYQRARIDARIAEVTPIVLELRRRGIKPQDQGRLSSDFSCAESGPCASMSSRRNNPALK